jgi:hypothetical protein
MHERIRAKPETDDQHGFDAEFVCSSSYEIHENEQASWGTRGSGQKGIR